MRLSTLALFASLAAACGATPDKIQHWKNTQRGPQKLHEVVADDGADPALRGQAVEALVEIGLAPDALKALGESSDAKRTAAVHESIAPLTTLLGQSATLPGPTTPAQRTAKDTLFELRSWADPADRARIDALLVQWTTTELTARAGLGGESTEKILTTIGPGAAPALVPLVGTQESIEAAKLIGVLGDKKSQQEATQKLETAVRGSSTGLAGVNEQSLHALGLIGGPEATRFLLEVAQKGGKDAREKALFALAQGNITVGDMQATAGGLAVAADMKAPPGVREAAFQLLEKLGPGTVPGLVRMFTDPNPVVRWRAVEAALKAGGASAIDPVLHGLPEDKPILTADLDSFVVHDLVLIGKDAITPLVAAATKKAPLAQIAALRALSKIGTDANRAALDPIAADPSTCSTLKPPSKVGDEARKAQAALATRK